MPEVTQFNFFFNAWNFSVRSVITLIMTVLF